MMRSSYGSYKLRTFFLLFSLFGGSWHHNWHVTTTTVVEAATVSVSVGGQSSSFLMEETEICEFEGGEIVMSHPMSIDVQDKHYVMGSTMLKAAQMTVDKINMWPRCGLTLKDGKNYSLTLTTYGDESDKNKTARIGNAIVGDNRTNFVLAGYSSSLTAYLTDIPQQHRKVCITGGSSRTSNHAGKQYVFGLNPPSKAYLEHALLGAASKGAKTVAFVAEDGANACDGTEEIGAKYGIELVKGEIIPEDAPFETYAEIAYDMKETNPDMMITCVRTRLTFWNQAMRKVDWTPKAQVYAYVSGTEEFETQIGPTDLPYIMGVSSWDAAIPPIPDLASGWTPQEFAAVYQRAVARRPSYQQVQQSAVVSVLAQAIERLGYFKGYFSEWIRMELETGHFSTVYGNVSFDVNGQNAAPFLLLQYDPDNSLHVLLPEDKRSTDFEMFYPLPGWSERDCLFESTCLATGGSCDTKGICAVCPMPLVSQGIGSSAACKFQPMEDMTYISPVLRGIGIAFFVLQTVLSVGSIIWVGMFRNVGMVKASQPIFLFMVALGCFVMVSSVLTMGIEAGYPTTTNDMDDLLTGGSDDPNTDEASSSLADFGCMASFWLYGIGFALTFSALFAKIWRIKKLIRAAASFRREQIEARDVVSIVAIMVALEVAILLSWQLVSPFEWTRTILVDDSDGFALKSVGMCTSDYGWYFILGLALLHIVCLIYAAYLCYITRSLPSKFAESKYVALAVASMLQILILAIPLLIMVKNDSNAFYFTRVCVISLQGAAVTILIFGPKIAKTLIERNNPSAESNNRRDISRSFAAAAAASKKSKKGTGRTGVGSSNEMSVVSKFSGHDLSSESNRVGGSHSSIASLSNFGNCHGSNASLPTIGEPSD